ncbi:MAG: transporter [Acidobacteriota bacterium]
MSKDRCRPAPSTLACLIVFSLGSSTAQAANTEDGFLKGKGRTELVLSLATERFDDFRFGSERMDLPPVFREIDKRSASVMVKHGLTDDLDLTVQLPYISSRADGDASLGDLPAQSESGLQDLSVQLKWRAAQSRDGRFSFLLNGGLTTPASDYVENALLSNGNGATALDLHVVFHHQAESGLFNVVQAGYSARTAGVPDAIFIGTKIGWVGDRFYFGASLDREQSTSGPDIGDPGFTFPATRVESTRLAVSTHWSFTPVFGASVGIGRYLDGRNLPLTTYYSLGLTFQLDRGGRHRSGAGPVLGPSTRPSGATTRPTTRPSRGTSTRPAFATTRPSR